MQRTFAIGDIHGCSKTLQKLLEEIKIDKQDEIYFLGDYSDRGPGSKEVVDFLLKLKIENYKLKFLRGNHEQMFMDSEKSFDYFENWLLNGGTKTLESFAVSRFSQLDEKYKTFFENTAFYFETNNFIFVHAGFNFYNKNIFEDTEAMLWIRDMKVDKRKIGNKIIVHGHTPTPLNEVKKSVIFAHKTGAVNIDTGCVMKQYFGLGYLSALEVETMQLHSIKNVD
ncbi:MAG: metallophosphoesterase family protein [Chitinophagaceae bacterium]